MTNYPAMTPQQREFSDVKKSGFSAYKRLAVGERSVLTLIFFELFQLISSNLPTLAKMRSTASRGKRGSFPYPTPDGVR
jgi:hypothetical protein